MRAPEFWAADGALPALLAPLGAGYALAGRLRRALARPVRLPVPVICIGNLVAGGAGKTPVALDILKRLAARGRAPHGLTRGYGGRARGPLRVDPARHDAEEAGDEALLLARAAPTWVARDRAAGGRAAIAAGADVLVLDDGFQNPRLTYDLALLVVDGGYGFGNGRVIPAGPLREPVAGGLARADAIVVLGEDTRGVARFLGGRAPVLRARLVPGDAGNRLAGRKVVAFAGIGRPGKFFATLDSLGADLVEARAFPDHHRYRQGEIDAILARADAAGAVPVTTEKDAVRLPADARARIETLAVTVAWEDPAQIDALLERAAEAARTRAGPLGAAP